jgi:protein involved in polysaccharide export with SLBB domain
MRYEKSLTPAMKILPLMLMLALVPLGGRGQETAAPAATPLQQVVMVNVLGAVNRPSQYSLAKGSTVLDALAMAGDFNAYAAKSKVKLIHKDAGAKPDVTVIDMKAMLEGNQKAPVLRDGDTVYVPQSTL